MLEIEAKIRINSTEEIRDLLLKKGALLLKKNRQTDTYFNSPFRDFAKTDEALRIRNEGDNTEITYKGPKISGGSAKAREEINIEVSNPEEFASLFGKLGFYKSTEVSKTREEYDIMDTRVALDIVDQLGEFIEIEVLSENPDLALEKIDEVRKELGITGSHIPDSYLEMILAGRADNSP